MINKWLYILACCLIFSAVEGQRSFKYKADLNTIDSAGFYRIVIAPALIAKSKEDLSDIRLADRKGHFIPFINYGNLSQSTGQTFVNFPQINLKSEADTGTTFIVECKGNLPINTLWLKLKNTAVKRTVNLSGSDDLKKWFAIEENVPLQQSVSDNSGAYLQALLFPASSYHYLKLLVNDKNKAPVEFLAAGAYKENKPADIAYQDLPAGIFSIKDSNKITYINIYLKDNYLVNLIRLKIEGPKYYLRDVAVYGGGKLHQMICSSQISSSGAKQIALAARADRLQLQIYNGDNPPLKVTGVAALQAPQSLVAYLETGKRYQLLTGDSTALTPVYDLNFFKDSVHDVLPVINTFPIRVNSLHVDTKIEARQNFTPLIWIAIAVTLLVLLALTRKMMTEVNNKPHPAKREAR